MIERALPSRSSGSSSLSPISGWVSTIRPLLRVQRGRLEQHAVRDPDLADVVEDRPEPHRLDLLGRQVQQLGHANGERGKPFAVPVEIRVACLDRVGERARERRREQAFAQLVAAAARSIECVLDGRLQVLVREGLRHEAGGAARERLAERVVGACARDEDDRQRRLTGANELEQLEPREARHDHVAHHEIEVRVVEQLQRALGVLGARDRVTGGLEDLHHEQADHGFVVDHQDAAHSGSPLGDRQAQRERGAVSGLRCRRQRPAVGLGDPEADGEPEAGSTCEALGREERIEDPLQRRPRRCPVRRR